MMGSFSKAADVIGWPNGKFSPESLGPKEVIHIFAGYPSFFANYRGRLALPYILVTEGHNPGIPQKCLPYLEDEKLVCWFTQNPLFDHPKLRPIPLGIDFRFGRQEKFLAWQQKEQRGEKKYLLCMNFAVWTYPKERQAVWDRFVDQPYCYVAPNVPYEQYLDDLASSQFVLSPRGMGLDCFRTWEALYVGSIPIVKTSPLDPLFEDLPVLIVRDWAEITEEFLIKKFAEISQKEYSWEKLTVEYWVQLIRSAKG